ncbi:MAG: hypothetical protein ACJAZ3_001346 [Sphingobacteriales bacterium]|jgi:hypothetical protein
MLNFCTHLNQILLQSLMADQFRASGKIFIVVGTITLIFLILSAYLVSLDLKLKKLEKHISDNQK